MFSKVCSISFSVERPVQIKKSPLYILLTTVFTVKCHTRRISNHKANGGSESMNNPIRHTLDPSYSNKTSNRDSNNQSPHLGPSLSPPPSRIKQAKKRISPLPLINTQHDSSSSPSIMSINNGGHTHIPLPVVSESVKKSVHSRLHYVLDRDNQLNSSPASMPAQTATIPQPVAVNSSPSSYSNLIGTDATSLPSYLLQRRSQHRSRQFSPSESPVSSSTASTPPRSSVSTPTSPAIGGVKETHKIFIDYDPVSGRKVLNTYEIVKSLGRGQHGKVKLGRDINTGEYVAIKIVERNARPRLGRRRESTQEEKIKREIAILKKCVHPNIVRLLEVLDDSNSKKIYLVLEYLEKGEVVWQTETGKASMTRKQAKFTSRDVLLGLEYLHFQGIIHRDIKPANLLLSRDGRVKISDFGVSYASDWGNDEYELAKTAGTPAFFAPELCITSSDVPRPAITEKIDIWAFGVTLFCLIYGCVPFIADSEFELFDVIVNQPLVFPDEQTLEKMEPSSEQKDSGHKPSSISLTQPPAGISFSQPIAAGSKPISINPRANTPLTPLESDADLELAKDLMRKLLEKDPEKRITLLEAKRHPWVCDGMDIASLEYFLKNACDQDKRIEVTGDEVNAAVQGITKKIKRGLTKFGNTALQIAGIRRRKSSASSSSSSRIPNSASTSRSNSREPPVARKNTSNPSSFQESPLHRQDSFTRHHSIGSSFAYSRPFDGGIASISGDTAGDFSRRSSTSSFSVQSSSYIPRKTMASSSSNLNLNALLEDQNNAELSRIHEDSVSHSATAATVTPTFDDTYRDNYNEDSQDPINALSLMSTPSTSSVSSSEEDNGELTLVLGPTRQDAERIKPKRGASESHVRSSSLSRTGTPRQSTRNRASNIALDDDLVYPLPAHLQQLSISGSSEQVDLALKRERSAESNKRSNEQPQRYRSQSVTVAVLQRKGIPYG